MIKVGIIGAEKDDAGELLRILLNHPETEITSLYSPSYAGRRVSACHHGFLGEDIVNFSDRIDLSRLDVVFLMDDSEMSREVLTHSEEYPNLRIIDLSPSRMENLDAFGMEYGLSEANRKPLVRGARIAAVPSSVAALTLLALHPLAIHLMLSSDIEIIAGVPARIAKSIDTDKAGKEIARMLSKTQTSFAGKVNVRIVPTDLDRTIRVRTTIKCPLSIAEVDKVFESVYDDHNFVFTNLSGTDSVEVEGTHKCVVSFGKPSAGLLELESVGDVHMRGGAGDAVHVLNLFFALDEKVGLRLKPSKFLRDENDTSLPASWFA